MAINKFDSQETQSQVPRVLLLIESSRAYGRGCLMGIASYTRSHGQWNVIHLERGLEEDVPSIVTEQRFDGVIARIETLKIAEEIEQLNIPTVDLRGVFTPRNGVSFNTDAAASASMAFDHFRERGFQNFGFCGYEGVDFSDERGRHFGKICRESGFENHAYPTGLTAEPNSQSVFGDTLLREATGEFHAVELLHWLHAVPKPIGIFACNDVRGRQLMAAARAVGIDVPGQVAVLGIDDDEVLCELANPPLSSIEPNTQRIGFEGAAALAKLMSGEVLEPGPILIPPIRVSVRQSSDISCVDDPVVALAIEFIKTNACSGIGVTDAARAASVSRATLERRFRTHLDCSPREEIERVRVARVKLLLTATDYSLERIASMTAFASASHLSTAFRRVENCTPGEYRKANLNRW